MIFLTWARRWPFTLLGFAALIAWGLAETHVISDGLVVRALIGPAYLMRLFVVAVGVAIWGPQLPAAVDLGTIPLLLTPYFLLDLLVGWHRQRPPHATSGTATRRWS